MDSSTRSMIYTSLADLAGLEHQTKGFNFLPRQPIHSVLAGRHNSRLRGRGLNFEEIRVYLPGDDIRNIDWKVTARLQKPHVRVSTEERDRPAILVVDQRIPMFFGSRLYVKSVTAARLAALFAWTIFHSGDRIGAVVHDPMALDMGVNGRLIVTEGDLQVEIDLGDQKVREPVLGFTRSRLQEAIQFLRKLAIPVLPVHTGEDVV